MPIRECFAKDYPSLAAFYRTVYPDRDITEKNLLEADKHRDPKLRLKRWITEKDGQIAAVGMYFQREWFFHPRTFRVSVLVRPEYRKQGLGSALYTQIVEGLRPLNPATLIADTYENYPDNIRFLEQRGFAIFIRDREMILDLSTFEMTGFNDQDGPLGTPGIEIKSASDLAHDPDRDRKLYELDHAISMDAPQAEYAPERSFEEYVTFALTGETAFPEAFFVALDGDDYVGFTQVTPSGKDTLYQLLTGVLRAYRRRGIALALKLRSITYAREAQFKAIITNNDPDNGRMLALNERLGFERQPDQLFFRKDLHG